MAFLKVFFRADLFCKTFSAASVVPAFEVTDSRNLEKLKSELHDIKVLPKNKVLINSTASSFLTPLAIAISVKIS